MQEMEPDRRPKINGLRRPRRPFHAAQLRVRRVRIRRHKIKSERHVRSDQMRLRASQVSAEALAFVALAVRRGIYDRALMVVVATIFVTANLCRHQRCFGNVPVRAVAGPMAAPARYGLGQHENCHQSGNECLHNDPRFYLIITIIGSPGNAACEKAAETRHRQSNRKPRE
jgi:hypothetical protein